ncbi:MAG: hypothetical protein JXA90_07945, partial [Planctomycetes bacterium]|nr:hypothetical protein [Planctomycetota bacterium]
MSSKAGMATAGGAFFTRHFPTFLGWTGNLGWPILLKQLRTEFRRNRFFYSHFACLACLGAALIFLILTLTGSQPNVTPTQVGQGIFDWFLRIQSLVVLIIFPLFSATAFTEERANLTLDLLLISRLRPAEIVWGKLLASTIYCLMHVMATLPLLAISFLFGGVTVDEVLLAYALLAGGTLLISMASLCISSLFSRSLASTLCVYTLLVAGLIAAWYFYPQTEDSAGKATGEVLLTGLLRAWNPGGELKWLHVTVWFADATAVFCFLFLVTANRIRPPADDRTSLLRCLTLTYFPLRVAAGFFLRFPSIVVQSAVPLAARIAADMQALILWSALFLLLATVAFSTEDADVSPRCRKQFRPLT